MNEKRTTNLVAFEAIRVDQHHPDHISLRHITVMNEGSTTIIYLIDFKKICEAIEESRYEEISHDQ